MTRHLLDRGETPDAREPGATSRADPWDLPWAHPAVSALVVVDVQNDYCHPGGALGRAGFDLSTIDPMVDVVEELIDAARRVHVPAIFLMTSHSERTDSPPWRRRVSSPIDICREGTWGAEPYRIVPGAGDAVVTKHRYSGFVGTDLVDVLAARTRSCLVVTGTATNVCVESTVRHARMLDFDVLVVEDGVAATDPDAHSASLANMARFFGPVVTSSLVRKTWTGEA